MVSAGLRLVMWIGIAAVVLLVGLTLLIVLAAVGLRTTAPPDPLVNDRD